jgi:hypothetical protein
VEAMGKLNVKAVALAAGITWAIYMGFCGWTAMFGWGKGIVEVMSSVYIGYSASFLGGIIGAVWGFADGLIGGAIFALIYNRIARK